ncbi:MAG: hypothetical protein ISR65_01860 [Bacteriovoracaceae bacterium]|nr:hypothetical protein [Bacteriovoracaceae bacterium]
MGEHKTRPFWTIIITVFFSGSITIWPNLIEDISSFNRQLASLDETPVKYCISQSKKTSVVKVDRDYKYQCSRGLVTYESMQARYKLKKVDELIKIMMSIELDYTHPSILDSITLAKEKIQRAYSCAQNFFREHDLLLELKLYHYSKGRPKCVGCDWTMKIYKYLKRADKQKLSLQDPSGTLDDEQFCALFIHELGHFMGLADQYDDSSICPGRLPSANSSFMGNFRHYTFRELFIDEMDVLKIIGPLCEE